MPAVPNAFDFFELLYYLAGFWLFLFSPNFRQATLDRWSERTGLRHVATALEIVSAVACGVVIPAGVLWYFFGAPAV